MTDEEIALKFLGEENFEARFAYKENLVKQKKWNGFTVFLVSISFLDDVIAFTGNPIFILVKNGMAKYSSYEENQSILKQMN